MTAPLDPHNPGGDYDFRQLTGAFDRPIAPSPNFADGLRQRVKEEELTMQQAHALSTRPVSNRTARASAPRISRRRWLDIVIAAAVILGMLASTFWYADVRIGGDDPTGPDATRYAAQPLSNKATPNANSTYVASDPGNVNAWPAGFDPEADLESTNLAGEITYPSYAVIASDTMIVQGNLTASGEKETNSIVAIDIETGAIRWNVPLTAKREFVTDGKSIFGFFAVPGRTDITLMAIDIEDGESRWHGPTFDGEITADQVAPIETMNLFGPTLVDQQLFIRTPEGNIVALNTHTGEQQWSMGHDGGTPDVDKAVPGSLVSDGQYLYDIDPPRTVRKIDLVDGSVEARIEPDIEETASLSWIFATQETLLVVSKSRGTAPQSLHAVSVQTGETSWSQPLGEVRPYITVISDVVAVAHYVPEPLVGKLDGEIDDTGLYTSFFDLKSGALISLQRPSIGDFATLSSSGNVICINQGVAVSCTDTAAEPPTLVTLPYSPGEGFYDPVMFYGDAAIIRGGEAGLVLIQPATQPRQASTFSDGDARGGSFGTTSDRSLVRPDITMPADSFTMTWSHVVSDPLWAMAYGDVVASLGSSEIAVQNAATGEILWSRPTSEAFRNSTYDTGRDPKLLLGQHQGQPIALPWVEGKTLYYATTTELVGVSLYTGEETFRTVHTIPAEGEEFESPHFPWDMAVQDSTAYVLTVPAIGYFVLDAIDLETGDIVWSYELGEPVSGDWRDASAIIHQLVVTGDAVAMQVTNGENSILALDASDGSVLWQQPNALLDHDESIASSSISAIDDQYLVLMHRSYPTGAIDGTPNADQSLGVALYNLEDGNLLWTAREGTNGWTYPDQGTGACSLVPGWTSTDLYIPCTTDDTVYLFNLPLSGNPTLVGTWETSARAWASFYDRQAAYLNTGTELLRIDYYSHEMTVVPITGGDTCLGGQLSENGIFFCMTDDGLGTYTIQAYAPTPSVATPAATP